MEPLSATASALTLVGTLTEGLRTIRSLSGTKQDLGRRQEETTHLQDVIRHVISRMSMGEHDIAVKIEHAGDSLVQVQASIMKVSRGKSWDPRVVWRRKWKLPGLEKDFESMRKRLQDWIVVAQLSMTPSNFETRATYLPEQYTVASRRGDTISLVAMTDISPAAGDRRHKYCIFYAENSRTWHRLSLVLTAPASSKLLLWPVLFTPDHREHGHRDFPSHLRIQVERTLRVRQFSAPLTELAMDLQEAPDGTSIINEDSVRLRFGHDSLDAVMKEKALQTISDSGTQIFRNGELLVRCRYTKLSYLVFVRGRSYVEQRPPFEGARPQDCGTTETYYETLTALHALRGCRSVVKFEGIVMDGQNPKSYLYEWAPFGNLYWILGMAKEYKHIVPWPVRQAWAKQLIEAVADLHSKDVILGALRTTVPEA